MFLQELSNHCSVTGLETCCANAGATVPADIATENKNAILRELRMNEGHQLTKLERANLRNLPELNQFNIVIYTGFSKVPENFPGLNLVIACDQQSIHNCCPSDLARLIWPV